MAQIAAVIGRESSTMRLLAAVADRRRDRAHGALDKLAAAELVFRRGTPPEASYTFKHALVRDAAYDSLLKSAAAALHRRLRRRLERVRPGRAGAAGAPLARAPASWPRPLRWLPDAGQQRLRALGQSPKPWGISCRGAACRWRCHRIAMRERLELDAPVLRSAAPPCRRELCRATRPTSAYRRARVLCEPANDPDGSCSDRRRDACCTLISWLSRRS